VPQATMASSQVAGQRQRRGDCTVTIQYYWLMYCTLSNIVWFTLEFDNFKMDDNLMVKRRERKINFKISKSENVRQSS